MNTEYTQGSIIKSLLKFSIPYLIACFLQSFYGMADLFITGQFYQENVITAVANGSQIMHFITVDQQDLFGMQHIFIPFDHNCHMTFDNKQHFNIPMKMFCFIFCTEDITCDASAVKFLAHNANLMIKMWIFLWFFAL